jgi:hypothetical protein
MNVHVYIYIYNIVKHAYTYGPTVPCHCHVRLPSLVKRHPSNVSREHATVRRLHILKLSSVGWSKDRLGSIMTGKLWGVHWISLMERQLTNSWKSNPPQISPADAKRP